MESHTIDAFGYLQMLGLLNVMRNYVWWSEMDWKRNYFGVLKALEDKNSEKRPHELRTWLAHIPSTDLVPYLFVSLLVSY
jgi:hypothetical protein